MKLSALDSKRLRIKSCMQNQDNVNARLETKTKMRKTDNHEIMNRY